MDITGFERSDKNKSGIISVFDFFCVGKAQTSIPMIVAAIQTLKSICIASCKQFFPRKFVKLDGNMFKKGDRIVAINGRSLENVKYESAVDMMRRADDTVQFLVSQIT